MTPDHDFPSSLYCTTPRWEIFKERYDTFDDPNIPRFHYGSHYSSAGIALYYLVRLEPFTSLAIGLQGGRFDLPDRLFDSISGAWDLSFNNISDVKVFGGRERPFPHGI